MALGAPIVGVPGSRGVHRRRVRRGVADDRRQRHTGRGGAGGPARAAGRAAVAPLRDGWAAAAAAQHMGAARHHDAQLGPAPPGAVGGPDGGAGRRGPAAGPRPLLDPGHGRAGGSLPRADLLDRLHDRDDGEPGGEGRLPRGDGDRCPRARRPAPRAAGVRAPPGRGRPAGRPLPGPRRRLTRFTGATPAQRLPWGSRVGGPSRQPGEGHVDDLVGRVVNEGTGAGPQPGFRHEALLYGSTDELTAVAAPFLLEGLEAGDTAVIAVGPESTGPLCAAVGGDPRVLVLERHALYRSRTPTAITTFRALATGHAAPGRRVRVVGEVDFGTTAADWSEWQRYESVINRAFAGLPLWGLCAFDTTRLPERLLETARATHPQLRTAAGRRPSPGYV